MAHWTILTCEYPPDCGGVGDYTAQVSAALAGAGDTVTVFSPPRTSHTCASEGAPATVDVVTLEDTYGRRGRRTIEEYLDRRSSTVPPAVATPILVQYVPTGFGMRGANIPWCRWLLERSRARGNDIRVMFHEPYVEFTWSPFRRNALAVAERLMASMLLDAASRVYLSTDAWRAYLEPLQALGCRKAFATLPIPSGIPRADNLEEIASRRCLLLGPKATRLVGHFGTFGSEVAPMLESALTRLITERQDVSAVCAGAGSTDFVRALSSAVPAVRGRLHAIGRAPASDVAVVLSACDLLLQPYPDGVTTRRTSIMAGLANARAVVTTTGHLTEPVWTETGAVALAAAGDSASFVSTACSLLSRDAARAALAALGQRAYAERFALEHTIGTLRGSVEGAAA